MSSIKLPETGRNQINKSPETVQDENSPHLPLGKKNIEIKIEPTEQPPDFKDSCEIEWEPSLFTPSLSNLLQAHVLYETDNWETEEIQNISSSLSSTKVTSDQSYLNLEGAKLLFPENTKKFFLYPSASTKTEILKDSNIPVPSLSKNLAQNPIKLKSSKNPNIAESSQSKYSVQNPFVKTKSDKGSSVAGPSGSKSSVHQLGLPLSKRKIAETFQLAEACRFFLVFMKKKRAELKYMESQLDFCTTEIQKAVRDAEQISLKLEDEPEAVARDLSAAKVQSQKLMYLLSISYRSYSRLNKLGSVLQECLELYSKDTEIFHKSVDRLLEYIVETIIQKCES